jgi:NADPH2:quinone reductase
MLAIRLHRTGGPEVLRVEDLPVPVPGPGEICLRVAAAGVNFIDTYHRAGLYAVALPHTLGQEAAGVVTAVGPGVTGFQPGARVASAKLTGAYADFALAPAAQAVAVPAAIDLRTAAAVMLQGLTAHYLSADTFPLGPDHVALVHAGAGGVGLLLIQLARRRGARVIATVGSDAKAELARAAGADSVCVYTRESFPAAVRAFTGGRGVDVAYDSVGRDTFADTLECLRPRGLFVSFGNSSGPVPPVAPLLLMQKGSLFLTRPTLAHHVSTPEELYRRAGELFRWIAGGELQVRIGATFPLAEAAEAHRALEGRATTGKVLLLPSVF